MKVRLVLLLCAATAAGLFLAGCEDKTAGDEHTLTYTEGKGEFGPIGDISKKSTPPGSGFAFSAPLTDDSGSEAGTLHAVCISTTDTPADELTGTCTGTVDLSGGQLALNVGGDTSGAITGSITGGNGDYEGATGTFESSGDKDSSDTFTYTLP